MNYDLFELATMCSFIGHAGGERIKLQFTHDWLIATIYFVYNLQYSYM